MTDGLSVLDRLERPWVAVVLCVTVYVTFAWLGFGTDIDVANVLEAGRQWLDHGTYAPSRTPGAAIHEISTAFIDDVGGSVLVNVVSVAFAGLGLWGLQDLLRREGSRVAGLAVLVLATNPWFWIAATSLGDFVWALGLLLAGAAAARRDHRVLAGVLFGLAVGRRLSTVFLVLAWLVAERFGDPSSRVPVRRTLTTAAIAFGLVALCCVPPWLAADRTLDFLQTAEADPALRVLLGRWAIKNVAFFGVLAAGVLLAGLPRLRRAWPAWRTSVPFRFALLAFVVTELVFLRYPLKQAHLIPAAMAVALVVGHLGTDARRWLSLLIAAQLVGGIVTTTIAAPDVEDRATTGSIQLGLTAGALVNDVQCRLDDRDDGPYDDGYVENYTRSTANFDCQLEAWRAHP